MKRIFILPSMLIIIIILFSQCGSDIIKNDQPTKEKPVITDNLEAKKVIESYMNFMNKKDEEGLRSLLTPTERNQESNFRLFNLNYVTLNKITLEEDIRLYDSYIKNFKDKDNLEYKDLIIYKVDYYIKYIDEKKEPIDSGDTEKLYYLIRNSNGEWKISDIGTM